METSSSPVFDFAARPHIVFGVGSLSRLGELVREYAGTRVMLVTDPGVIRCGHAARAEQVIRSAGLPVLVFDAVVENPTTRVVQHCAEAAGRERIDLFVALGGGSSLDTAKGANFLVTNGGRMEDYWGHGKATRPMLPMIAVPTTAGTGSECQSFALISQEATHVKMACGDLKAVPKVAVLDPELTLTQPATVAAATGMDALSHAIESAVSLRRSPLSQMLSFEAFRLCSQGLRRIFAEPRDLDARGSVLLGAALAGMAIENSMLGAAHAAANPLTARFGVVHGRAVGLMVPAVVRFNAQCSETRRLYGQLALRAGLIEERAAASDGGAAVARYVEGFRESAGLPSTLADVRVERHDLEALAREASGQWTAQFNPRPVDEADFRTLYESVLHA